MRENEPAPYDVYDEEVYMMAAERVISSVFRQADDDSIYHHDVSSCRKKILDTNNQTDSSDVAESFLGWTLLL